MLSTASPFVLLDDARPVGGGASRLYRDPVEVVRADWVEDVVDALERLDAAQRGGLHAAGYLTYEAGAAFDVNHPPHRQMGRGTAARSGMVEGNGALSPPPLAVGERSPSPCSMGRMSPILWFGLFRDFIELSKNDVTALFPDPAGAWAGTPDPELTIEDYSARFTHVQRLIAAGDIYQANLSFRARVPVAGDPLALYARLRAASDAGWGGMIFTGEHWLLSASPELFFSLSNGELTARPMKGTTPRRPAPAEDAAAIDALAASPKDRAENLMIVDLLRNDLSRVAKPGSVQVPALFEVETYPTIHTMTSTVTAELAPGKSAIDVLSALFPCGSVTGAPKIRAMEIIADAEPSSRGPYTGSMGWLDPAGDAAFNVIIRTLTMDEGAHEARIGLGGAVVADSTVAGEWAEALAKGRFVTAGARGFDLIETMAFDPMAGLLRLERHLARMKASADRFGFRFDRHDVRNELQAATFRLRAASRVRLLLSRTGTVAIEIRAAPPAPIVPVTVCIAPLPVSPRDFRLAHKTTDRDFYRDALDAADTFEVIFEDCEGFLTEGSFTSLFVERDGRLLTPPLERGLLPGVLRAELIEEGRAAEHELRREDLTGGFLLGNAVRGLFAAILA